MVDPGENDEGEEETYGSALLNLFLFSGLMFTLPIASFFLGKQWLNDNYPLEAPYDQVCSLTSFLTKREWLCWKFDFHFLMNLSYLKAYENLPWLIRTEIKVTKYYEASEHTFLKKQLAPALLAIVLVNVIIVLYVCKALRIEAREKAKLKSGGRLKKRE